MLAGRPKLGKSWLALQLAQASACGGKVFEQSVEPGPVLYIALEDSERRLQQRLQLQGWPATAATQNPEGSFGLDTRAVTAVDATEGRV